MVLLLIGSMSSLIFAQNETGAPSKKVHIGFKVGANFSKLRVKDDNENMSSDFKMTPGAHMGLIAEFAIAPKMLSFETGMLFTTKGFQMSDTYSKVKATILYMDIPLTAKLSFKMGSSAKYYFALGPYIGLGLYGEGKTEETISGRTTTDVHVLDWGSDPNDDDIKRLDIGLIAATGVEIKFIQIGISYGLGLANISPYTDNGTKMNNRVLGLSLGFKF
jgi:hypothetical protein